MVSPQEVRQRLEAGDLSAPVGEFESEVLECKGQPYQLDTDRQKLELAKDVSALANADGGVILLGYATTLDQTHGEERIESVRMFDKALFDPQRYEQVLAAWLWPGISGLEIVWYGATAFPEKGVAAIFVPRVEGLDRPVLVAKTVLDDTRRGEIIFGYCERRLARVAHHSVQRLQALLRDGSRLDQEFGEGLQGIQAILGQLQNPPLVTATVADRTAAMEEKVVEAVRTMGFGDVPTYVLTAMPRRAIDVPIFQSRGSQLVKTFDEPPELRRSGFDLATADSSKIIAGGALRRSVLNGFRIRELHRDGAVIFASRGDEALCWGRPQQQTDALLINQLVLVENSLLFVRLAFDVYRDYLRAGDVLEFCLRLLRMQKGGKLSRLQSGPLQGFSWGYHEAPAESAIFTVLSEVGCETPQGAAFRLVREVYGWFGFDEESIPYAALKGGQHEIDESAIVSVSG